MNELVDYCILTADKNRQRDIVITKQCLEKRKHYIRYWLNWHKRPDFDYPVDEVEYVIYNGYDERIPF